MLDHSSSRIVTSQMMPLRSTVSSIEEGVLLVASFEGGRAVVGPSAGSGSEQPVGIARSQTLNPTVGKRVETVVVPASSPYTVTLAKTPLAPSTRVGGRLVATGAAMVYGGGVDATGEFSISGNVATFAAADAGKTVELTYEYNLTVVEAQFLYGQGIGDAAQSVINGTDVITSAQVVYTDKFNPADNWAAGGAVRTGANGEFTLSGSGKIIETCYVIEAPSASNSGFLGLYFSI